MKLHRGSRRSQLSECIGRATCSIARARQTNYELPTFSGFERVAQEYEQAARDEVHVAVAQAADKSRAEIWERMVALENQAEQTWTSHSFCIIEWAEHSPRRLQKHQRQSYELLQEYHQGVRRDLSDVQPEVQIQQVASRDEAEK